MDRRAFGVVPSIARGSGGYCQHGSSIARRRSEPGSMVVSADGINTDPTSIAADEHDPGSTGSCGGGYQINSGIAHRRFVGRLCHQLTRRDEAPRKGRFAPQ
jgi:hypothetical protein